MRMMNIYDVMMNIDNDKWYYMIKKRSTMTMNVPLTGITTSHTCIHVGKIEIHCRYINMRIELQGNITEWNKHLPLIFEFPENSFWKI